MKWDMRVNAFGINYKDVKPGTWVELDMEKDEPTLALFLGWDEKRSNAYKGPRSIIVYWPDTNQVDNCQSHTQIKRLVGELIIPTP